MTRAQQIAFIAGKLIDFWEKKPPHSATAFAELIVEGLEQMAWRPISDHDGGQESVMVFGPIRWNNWGRMGVTDAMVVESRFQHGLWQVNGGVCEATHWRPLPASPDLPGFDRRNQDG